jgi:cytochrome bd ubiquinol oxidase subunit I
MSGDDAVLLARAQFAFTVGFHIVLPAFTIGLASYLAVLEGLWLWTARQVYLDVFQYWLKAFATVFGMGVVSGVVMAYEFGTNWARFSDKVGAVIGPLMGYEVMTAFFLEAGFLGIMLFGRERVGRTMHFIATVLVATGTLMSAFWILAANSWMQTPQGHTFSPDGRFLPADWWQIIFNPSFPYRLVHMVIASYLSVAFVVGAVGAFHLRRDAQNQAARLMFSMAMWMAVVVAPIQILAGDQHGLNTLQYQPAKIAALEGDWETRPGTPLILFGMPNMQEERTNWAVEIPHLGALILTHSWDGAIKGLKDFPPQDRPPSPVVFWAFRIMVGLGVLMAGIGLWAAWLRMRGRLYTSRWLPPVMLAMAPSGFIALLAGWTVTEVGRQPFTVHGLLRTADSVSPVGLPGVASSLAGFVVVYLIVFGAGFVFLARLMRRPPTVGESGPPAGIPTRSAGITPAAALHDGRTP